MTKNYISSTRTVRRITFLQISFLLLALTFSCGKKNSQNSRQIDYKSEWWYPVVQKHKIDLKQFNYIASFVCVNDSNFIVNKWLELGSDNGSDEKYLKLKDALIIVMFDTTNLKSSKQNYWILSSPSIFHDLERKTIDYDSGKTVWYDINDNDVMPLDSTESYGKFDFNNKIKIAPASFRKLTP
jgi:hypothetical protein